MNELEDMKKIWKQENTRAIDKFPPAQPVLAGSLNQQLELFQHEQGYGSSVAGAIVMIIMALLTGGLAWKKDELFGFIAMAGLLLLAAGMILFARKWRRASLHRPEQNLHSYLKSRYKQLTYLRWLTYYRILTGVTVAAFFFHIGGEFSFNGDAKSSIGIIAFIVLALFLSAVLIWWYQTQHPYRPDQLRKEILELLDQFNE